MSGIGKAIRIILIGSTILVGFVFWRISHPPQGISVPEMPENWKLINDKQLSIESFKHLKIEGGINFSHYRFLLYDVDGKDVNMLIYVADSAGDLERYADLDKHAVIPRKALGIKKMSFTRDLTLYELVSQDDALAEIRAGIRHLKETLP